MNTLRALLAIFAGTMFGCGAALLILGLGAKEAGIWLALGAALFVVTGLIRWVQRQSREAMRREREAVWQRRIDEARASGVHSIPGGQDPDWIFKAPFWQLPSFDDEVQR